MSTFRDQQQAQATRPFRPRLAVSQPTAPRQQPALRLAAQRPIQSPPTTAPPSPRKPLGVLNGSSSVRRPSPASGRLTPIRSFTATNTSPRSPARFQKSDSARSTPTPTLPRNTPSVLSPLGQPTVRPRITRGVTASSAPVVSQRPAINTTRGPPARPLPTVAGSMRATPAAARPQRPAMLTKSPSFFHADEIPVRSSSPDYSPPKNTSRFVYASADQRQDGASSPFEEDIPPTPAADEVRPHDNNHTIPVARRPSVVLSQIAGNNTDPIHPAAPISRSALPELDSTSETTGTAKSFPVSVTSPIPSSPLAPLSNVTARRLPSLSSAPSLLTHRPVRSISSSTSMSTSQHQPHPTTTIDTPTIIPAPTQTSATTEPPPPNSLEAYPPTDNTSEPTNSLTQSPSNQDQNNPTSARHERKLLDLEISNSSLLALNRSLEREVAKQKAELRRLRRTSAGNVRHSWLSDSNADDGSELGSRLSEVNDLEGAGIGVGGGGGSTEENANVDSPGRQRRRTRVSSAYFDLAKHKQILADTQRMNTALQRCLGITDTLIKDGDKALEHRESDTSRSLLREDENDDEDAEENQRFRTVQEEMYARQAEVEELVRAWQGVGVGLGTGGGNNSHRVGANTTTTTSISHIPARSISTSRKENEKETASEKEHDHEDRDSGIDVTYSGRSSELAIGAGMSTQGLLKDLAEPEFTIPAAQTQQGPTADLEAEMF